MYKFTCLWRHNFYNLNYIKFLFQENHIYVKFCFLMIVKCLWLFSITKTLRRLCPRVLFCTVTRLAKLSSKPFLTKKIRTLRKIPRPPSPHNFSFHPSPQFFTLDTALLDSIKPPLESGTSHISYPIWRPTPFVRSFNLLENSNQNKPEMAKNIPSPSRHRIRDYFMFRC